MKTRYLVQFGDRLQVAHYYYSNYPTWKRTAEQLDGQLADQILELTWRPLDDQFFDQLVTYIDMIIGEHQREEEP